MANDLSIVLNVTGLEEIERNFKRVKWLIGDGREVEIVTPGHYRRSIAFVLSLGAEPDARLLAAAHLERFVAGCPDSLYEMSENKKAIMIAAGVYRMSEVNPATAAALRANYAMQISLESARVATEKMGIAAYEFSLSMATAVEHFSERLGKLGIAFAGSPVKRTSEWRRAQLLYYGYPDLLWLPVEWSDRFDDILYHLYGRLPDRAIDWLYLRWRPYG